MKKLMEFTFYPGQYYSKVGLLRRITPHLTNRVDFIVRFDESIKYTTKNPVDQADYMKIFGFREATVEDNSGRVGFRWYNEELQFAPYVHFKGDNLGADNPPIIYKTKNVKEEIHGFVESIDDRYLFGINGKPVTEKRGGGGLLKFFMWPYLEANLINEIPIKIKLQIL